MQCGNCGEAYLCPGGYHALVCARGESTRGHNDIRDDLHAMARTVDATAETEPEGLIPSHPRLRPADVLTSAFTAGQQAAVDVGITAPGARGSGADCVVTMHQRKHARLQPFQEEFENNGVVYRLFIISAWGRMHPEADATELGQTHCAQGWLRQVRCNPPEAACAHLSACVEASSSYGRQVRAVQRRLGTTRRARHCCGLHRSSRRLAPSRLRHSGALAIATLHSTPRSALLNTALS